METLNQSSTTKQETISLNPSTNPKRNAIDVPSFWDKTRSLGRQARAVTSASTQKARAVTHERVVKPVARVHNTNARDTGERAHQIAERASAEVAGFASGVTKLATGLAVGFTAGVVTGVGGVSAKQLKAIRMKGASDEMHEIGNWTEQVGNNLIMDLDRDLQLQPAQPQPYEVSVEQAKHMSLDLPSGDDTEATCIPIFDGNRQIGWIIAEHTPARVVYTWYDATEKLS